MTEEIKPVQKEENAGAPEGVKEGQSAPIDTKIIAELLEASDQALKKAEDKIVSLKRKIKSGEGGEGDEDLRDEITQLKEELQTLKNGIKEESSAEISELRKKLAEIATALKAKNSISNTGAGSNQSKIEVEEDPTKGYSEIDLSILRRTASRKGMELKEYLKTLKK